MMTGSTGAHGRLKYSPLSIECKDWEENASNARRRLQRHKRNFRQAGEIVA
jgi:hypothetical protein